jgi:hypothetical protein
MPRAPPLPSAATGGTGLLGTPGTSGTSGTQGDTAGLQARTGITASKAIQTRGYARRSVNLFVKKCQELLNQIEEQETQNLDLENLCLETYQKLKTAFEKFENENARVLSATDVTEAQVAEAEGLYEDLFKEFNGQESAILAKLGRLAPTRTLTRLGVEPMGPYEAQVQPMVVEPEEKPQFRFRGPPPKVEKEEERALQLMMRAMTLSYKPAEHITPFDGDQFQYTSYRTSVEIADRTMTEIGYSDFEKFLELKKTLKGEPLKLVATLPNLDSSYTTALGMLDRFYLNPQNSIKHVTDSINALGKMTNSVESIKSFYQALVSITHAFKALNMVESDMGRSLLLNSVMPKLSNACCREFLKITQKKRNFNSPMGHDATIADLMDCILFQLQLAQQMKEIDKSTSNEKAKATGKEQQKQQGNFPFKTYKVAEQKGGETRKPSCYLCKKDNHSVKDCYLLKTMKSSDLFDKISELRLCKICLWPHKTSTCKFVQQNLCQNCKGRHNTAIHLTKEELTTKKEAAKSKFGNFSAQAKHLSNTKPVKLTSNKAMEAVPHVLQVHLTSTSPSNPKSMKVNVLFDTGSSINLVRKEVADKLKLETTGLLKAGGSQEAVGVGNVPLPIDLSKRVSFTLSSMIGSKYQSPTIEGYVTEVIDSDLGGLDFDPQKIRHLKNIELSMPMPQQPIKVDVLLGEPWVTFFTTSAPIKDPSLNEPHVVAIKTKLGNFLGGSNRLKVKSILQKEPSEKVHLDNAQILSCNGIKKDQSGNQELGQSQVDTTN